MLVICQGKTRDLRARSGERALRGSGSSLRTSASRLVVPAPAGPDIHLLSRAPKSLHRRLSLCSLPVPKQFEESLRSETSFAQSPNVRDLAACASIDPDVFVLSLSGKVFTLPRSAEFSRRHEILLSALDRHHVADHLPGHGKRGPVGISSLQFSAHGSSPVPGTLSAPAWRLRSALSGCACCAVSIAACASPCRPNSSHRRTGRSS